jgi:SAM-dependent methyltransferase
MFRVSGGKKSDVFLGSGRETRDDFAAALEAHGRSFADFQHVLDFGCGCGRVLRWLRQEIAAERLSGSDIDKPAIQWLRWNMPGIDVRTNGGLPPLSFAASTFDLVLGYSVFSHLDEEYQNAWLAELQRVTKPGAFLLLTVQGPYNWQYTKRHILNRAEDLPLLDRQFEEAGFLYWKNDGWGSHFPEYYHSAWHAPSYVRRSWSRWFDVLDIRDAGARPTQDLIVLRKR